MSDEPRKSQNRVKKEEVVTNLNDKFGKAKAVVFTNYQGLTHKQLEELKRAIKPMQGELVVAKNSLLLRSLDANKLKLEDEKKLEGPTGTIFMYDDIISPLKALAKMMKDLNLPTVKFGIMDQGFITGEQVLKLSTLPTKEVLLAQLVGGLKSPIFGLHHALNWNLQKLVLTLGAVAKSKPADSPKLEQAVETTSEKEPETILDETIKEELQEKPADEMQKPAETQPLENKDEVVDKGGEN